jgi:transcriptional regulator with XRE-family HTH domain
VNETFGRRLQRLRQAAGISQPKLSAAANVPIGTLRSLEQDRRIPRLDTASALADALGVGLDTLAGGIFHSGKTTAEPAPKRTAGKGRKRKGE